MSSRAEPSQIIEQRDTARVIRLVALFVAGMVVAVGSALIYEMRLNREVDSTPRDRTVPQVVTNSTPAPAISAIGNTPPAQNLPDADKTIVTVPEKLPEIARPAHSLDLRAAGMVSPMASSLGTSAPVKVPPPPDLPQPSTNLQNATSPVVAQTATELPRPVPPPREQPAQRPARVVTLEPGTAFVVRLEQTLATDRNATNDTFRGALQAPLVANGFVIAERGAGVTGRITYAHQARLHGASELMLVLTGIHTSDGQWVTIHTEPWEEKGAHANMAGDAKMLVEAPLGAVLGAISGAARGAGISSAMDDDSLGRARMRKNALVLNQGTELTFRLLLPTAVTERMGGR